MSDSIKTQNPRYKCSFCNKLQGTVKRLIAGPAGVFICDECVGLCGQIITDESPRKAIDSSEFAKKTVNPKWLHNKLNEYIIGQEEAKKVVSVAVYNHYKRLWSNKHNTDIEVQKSNILILGPAGSGKTLVAQTLAKILDVPFSIVDATSLTEAGYVGEDVENVLLRLINAANFDISKAERGIIYIDEIDKIARKSPNPSITRDVSGEGVQQGLLKIIEGCVASVPPQGGRKHPHQEFLQIKTDNILFICGGAFEGLLDITEKRLSSDMSIGFTASKTNNIDTVKSELFQHVSVSDLLKYGFIPELVGRLPVIVGLKDLDKNALTDVLLKPKNSLIKQYQALFEMEDVKLSFHDDAIDAMVDDSIKHETGARGLRTVLESTLLDVMYELPDLKNVVECIIGIDCVTGDGEPEFIFAEDDKTTLKTKKRKTA